VSDALAKELEVHGIVALPGLVGAEQLRDMQEGFAARLRRQRFNDVDGYERTEPYRLMVQDVLTLAQGFVDLALHPTVRTLAAGYVGPEYALTEAKGWESRPCRHDFHGWHGDAWYDQAKCPDMPRELKLGFYLSDVRSGAFQYVRGSQRRQAPRHVRKDELATLVDAAKVVEMTGPAGTAFLFDTSGIHRQSIPILEPRRAFFYCYHDPHVPLQQEDVDYYRYHPLLLNAAFLGGLDEEKQRVLGFGEKTNYRPAFVRESGHRWFRGVGRTLFALKLWAGHHAGRVTARLRRLLRLG
jgi:hypothetical protein